MITINVCIGAENEITKATMRVETIFSQQAILSNDAPCVNIFIT